MQEANISLGYVDRFAGTVPLDDAVTVEMRSVMGVEIPTVSHPENADIAIPYGLLDTNLQLDEAYMAFCKVRDMTLVLAEVDTGVFRLAAAIQATQRRANALKNVLIPKYTNIIRTISAALEDAEREERSRMKVIKGRS